MPVYKCATRNFLKQAGGKGGGVEQGHFDIDFVKVLNLIVSVPLTNKSLFAPLQCELRQNLVLVAVKLIEYIFLKSVLYHQILV